LNLRHASYPDDTEKKKGIHDRQQQQDDDENANENENAIS